ncbi:MAG: DUF1573 domain-containing protein [Bacteroidetes bacterium]|nr:DUF1573 domain-containing protein [Bacteroidota bacterium]
MLPAMKKILIAAFIVSFCACTNKQDDGTVGSDVVNNTASANGKTDADMPEIKFEEEEFDFGKITQGEIVSHAFTFKNIGGKNLIISGASGSCGCTVPQWPKEPIKAGETNKINVVFNSEGKSGLQDKTITVITNCEPATRVIRIKTEIIVAETAK